MSAPRLARGQRKALLSRTTLELRAKLEEAAAQSGRSLGQEVEHRLEMTFAKEAMLDDLRRVLGENADDLWAKKHLPANSAWFKTDGRQSS